MGERPKSVDGIRPRFTRQETVTSSKDVQTETVENKNFINRYPIIFGWAAIAAIAYSGYSIYKNLDNKQPDLAQPEAITEVCSDSWQMEELISASSTKSERDLVDGGVVEMKQATSDKEMQSGVYIALDKYRENPTLLAYASEIFLKDKVDPKSLRDSKGCATPKAEEISTEIRKMISLSVIEKGYISADGFNTYVDSNGNIVRSQKPGIKGELKVAEIHLPDGRIVRIDPDCANFQFPPEKPIVPKKPYVPPVIEKPKPRLEPKDASEDVAANPKVADYKKDDTDGKASRGHKVDDNNKDDGYKNPIGEQKNPTKDAEKAEEKAEEIIEELEETHEEAREDAVVVDKNQSHEESKPLPANW